MKTRPWTLICLGLMIGVLLFGVGAAASAMSSPGFRLDWHVDISGAGGGRSNSTAYAAEFTVGQNAVSTSSGTNYNAGLGNWAATPFVTHIYLPTMLK